MKERKGKKEKKTERQRRRDRQPEPSFYRSERFRSLPSNNKDEACVTANIDTADTGWKLDAVSGKGSVCVPQKGRQTDEPRSIKTPEERHWMILTWQSFPFLFFLFFYEGATHNGRYFCSRDLDASHFW